MSDSPHIAQGPSSFEMQHAAGGNNRSSMSIPSDQGTAAKIGKGLEMSHLSGALDLGVKGADVISSHILGEGIFNQNMLAAADGPFISPGKINAFEGMGEFNTVGNMSIADATGIAKVTGLIPEGNTGPLSQGEGQGH